MIITYKYVKEGGVWQCSGGLPEKGQTARLFMLGDDFAPVTGAYEIKD